MFVLGIPEKPKSSKENQICVYVCSEGHENI